MEKLTAEMIRDIMIGETNGHMATIPNNPIIFSIFKSYSASQDFSQDINKLFIAMLEDMAKALKDEETT